MSHPPEADNLLAEVEHEIEHTSHNVNRAVILVIVTALLQIMMGGIYLWNGYKERLEESRQYSLDRQFNALLRWYDRQNEKYKEIEYPLIALRVAMIQIETICQGPKPLSLAAKQELTAAFLQRDQRKVELIQAFGASQVVFGDDAFNQLKVFVADINQVEALQNSCSPAVPSSEVWRQKGRAIEETMFQSLERTHLAIAKILENSGQ